MITTAGYPRYTSRLLSGLTKQADGGTDVAGVDDNYAAFVQDPSTGEWITPGELAARQAYRAAHTSGAGAPTGPAQTSGASNGKPVTPVSPAEAGIVGAATAPAPATFTNTGGKSDFGKVYSTAESPLPFGVGKFIDTTVKPAVASAGDAGLNAVAAAAPYVQSVPVVNTIADIIKALGSKGRQDVASQASNLIPSRDLDTALTLAPFAGKAGELAGRVPEAAADYARAIGDAGATTIPDQAAREALAPPAFLNRAGMNTAISPTDKLAPQLAQAAGGAGDPMDALAYTARRVQAAIDAGGPEFGRAEMQRLTKLNLDQIAQEQAAERSNNVQRFSNTGKAQTAASLDENAAAMQQASDAARMPGVGGGSDTPGKFGDQSQQANGVGGDIGIGDSLATRSGLQAKITGKTTINGVTEYLVRTDTGTTPAANVDPFYKLPPALSRSAPRYGANQLAFDSDLDRAAYITANQSTASKANPAFLKFIADKTGMTPEEARVYGQVIKQHVADSVAQGAGEDGLVRVPSFGVEEHARGMFPPPPAKGVPVPPPAAAADAAPALDVNKPLLLDEANQYVNSSVPTREWPTSPEMPTGAPETANNVGEAANDLLGAGSGVKRDINLTDELTSLVGLPRTLKASMDISAPGRQGLALAFRHPVEWAQSWKPMIQAWSSDSGMAAVNKNIEGIMEPWRQRFNMDPMHFYDVGGASTGINRVPGFEANGKGVVANLVRRIPGLQNSERAYATFLNYQKAKTFDTMASSLLKGGTQDPAAFRNLGAIIDHATGYGAAPLKGQLLGQAFFSQRFFTSRIQFLTDPIVEGLMKGDMQAAKAATENLVAFGGGMAGILALGNETGAWHATLDPRSTDFGKVRVGGQRLDFGAGFLPVLRTAAREITGESKATTGSVYKNDRLSEAVKFFRNKLAPVPSEAITRLTGTDAVGNKPPKVLSPQEASNLFMPLVIDSTKEAWNETHNPLTTARAGISEMVGGGSSTYGSGQAQQADLAKQQFGKDYDSLYADQQSQLNKQIADSGTPLPYSDRNQAWYTARDDGLSRWHADIGSSLSDDPFVQQALKTDKYSDLDSSLSDWARQTYGLSRQDAEAAVSRFESATKLSAYVDAYQKGVLANDPGFLDSWNQAYEDGKAKYPPPKWAKDFVTGLTAPVGASR